MSQVFNLKRRISDVIKWECNYQYTRSTITVSNTGSSDLELLAGQQYVASTGTLFTGASEAIPLQQSVTIGGTFTPADTITISGTTYTCVAGASTAAGTTEFEPTATPEEIAAIIVADPLTISNFTVSRDGAAVLITQTVPGTGSALTSGDVTVVSATGTATLATVHEYTAASATDFDCILVYPEVIPPGDSRVVTVLSNGPAIVDINVVMAANASANTQEAVVKRLDELGIKITTEPAVTAYQET